MLSEQDLKLLENQKDFWSEILKLLNQVPSRRERIATAILPKIYSGAGYISEKYAAELAIKYADALIAKLDK